MVAITTNQDILNKLFAPDSYHLVWITNTVEALDELNNAKEKIEKIITFAFLGSLACAAAAPPLAYLSLPTLAVVSLGVGILGFLALYIYTYAIMEDLSETPRWLHLFQNTFDGDPLENLRLFRNLLKAEYRNPEPQTDAAFKQWRGIVREPFTPNAINGFSVFDYREASIWSWGHYPLGREGCYAASCIFILIQVLRMTQSSETISDESFDQLKANLRIAELLTHWQRCNYPSNEEKEFFALFQNQPKDEVIEKARSMPLPTKLSIPHGILLETISWLSRFLFEFSKNEGINFDVNGAVQAEHGDSEDLSVWKIHLQRGLALLQRNPSDYAFEIDLVQKLLEAPHMRAFCALLAGVHNDPES